MGLALGMVVMGTALISFILYLWSKRFPEEEVRLYGIIKVRGTYLPFAMLLLDLVLGNDPTPPLIGIIVGHVYFYIVDTLRNNPDSPEALRGLHRYLETPLLLCYALGVEPTTRAAPGRPLQRLNAEGLRAAALGTAWVGHGQRLDGTGGGGGGGVGGAARDWLGAGAAKVSGWARSGAAAVGSVLGGGGAAAVPPRPAPGFHPLQGVAELPRAATLAAAPAPPAAPPPPPSATGALTAEQRRELQAAAAEARMKAAREGQGGGT